MVAGGSQGHWIYFCDVICSKKRTLNYIVFVCEFTVSDIYTLLPRMSFQSIFTSEPYEVHFDCHRVLTSSAVHFHFIFQIQ